MVAMALCAREGLLVERKKAETKGEVAATNATDLRVIEVER